MTEIIYKQDREDIDKIAADIIAKSINKIASEKEFVVLGIPGGRSVPGIFNVLKDTEIPWDKVHIFMVDERLVPLDHKDSNFRLAKESFIDELIESGKLPEKNVHPFVFDQEKEDKGIISYKEELKRYGGKYDIILLSSGEDGHIGALYPGHHSIEDESEFFIEMNDSPKPPPDRMTLSRKLLLKSKAAIILFLGEGKREAYEKFSDDSLEFNSCPAKLVQSIEKSYALTDIK